MVISYGVRKTGTIESIPEEKWGVLPVETNTIYEFQYDVPKKHPMLFWAWWIKFDPADFTQKLRKEIATKMEVTIEEIEIIGWYYNNELEPSEYKMQWAYIPSVASKESPEAKVAGLVVLLMVAIVCGTLIVGMFKLTGEPQLKAILKITEEMEKWLEKLKPLMKYGLYIVIAGGGIWLAGKVISKLGKKGAKT